jgi:hypothetical protein
MFVHGSNYYLKSVYQSSPRSEITKSVFKRLSELNSAPGNEIQHSYLFEYMPHRVALTIPIGATAFFRTLSGITASSFKWSRNTRGVEDAAKRAARELTSIVAHAEAQVSGENKNSGYGNLSQYLFIVFGVVTEGLSSTVY